MRTVCCSKESVLPEEKAGYQGKEKALFKPEFDPYVYRKTIPRLQETLSCSVAILLRASDKAHGDERDTHIPPVGHEFGRQDGQARQHLRVRTHCPISIQLRCVVGLLQRALNLPASIARAFASQISGVFCGLKFCRQLFASRTSMSRILFDIFVLFCFTLFFFFFFLVNVSDQVMAFHNVPVYTLKV